MARSSQTPEGWGRHEGLEFELTWIDGSQTREDSLSYGQKRLLALLWWANASDSAPFIADELTNGLHLGYVRAVLDALEGRQALHAVQNPLLVDLIGPGDLPTILRRFVLCRLEADPTTGARRWVWRNPTEAEAERLRGAWEAGYQTASELLFQQDLW